MSRGDFEEILLAELIHEDKIWSIRALPSETKAQHHKRLGCLFEIGSSIYDSDNTAAGRRHKIVGVRPPCTATLIEIDKGVLRSLKTCF